MMKQIRAASSCLLLIIGACMSAGVVQAGIITISTSDGLVRPGMDNQGWWGNDFTNNNSTNDNYITNEASGYRSYFTFDLSAVVENILSAELQVRRYFTDSGATLELFDVSTSAADLAQRSIIDNAIYADLGTGTSYGTFLAGQGGTFDIMSFNLNAAGVADANAGRGGYFSIGGASTNGVHFSSSSDEPGNSGTNFIQQLVLTTGEGGEPPSQVPAPATLALLGLGFIGLRLRRKG